MGQAESNNIVRNDIDNLLDDIEYLIYELEALKSVIKDVEYNDQPPGSDQLSILEKLRCLGYVQANYYEKLLKSVVDHGKDEVNLSREGVYNKFFESISSEKERQQQDIEEVLSEVIGQREELLSRLKGFNTSFWDREFERYTTEEENKITLYSLMNEMVGFERSKLKEIAERVQIMSIDREQQRQMRAQNK